LGVFYIVFALLALPVLGVVGAFHGFFSVALSAPQAHPIDAQTQEAVEQVFSLAVYGIAAMVLLHVVLGFYVGVCFRKFKHHTLCLIAAAFCCLSFPLGTILGVFSIVVLMKPEAKYLFGLQPASQS